MSDAYEPRIDMACKRLDTCSTLKVETPRAIRHSADLDVGQRDAIAQAADELQYRFFGGKSPG